MLVGTVGVHHPDFSRRIWVRLVRSNLEYHFRVIRRPTHIACLLPNRKVCELGNIGSICVHAKDVDLSTALSGARDRDLRSIMGPMGVTVHG